MSYKIKTVGPVEQFNGQYGPMKSYQIQFEGSDDWVKLNQKPDSSAPTIGQELEGTIEDGQWGKRFKKAPGASGGFSGGRSSDPEQRGSIERQSSLKAAVEAVYNFHLLTGEKPQSLAAYRTNIIIAAKEFSGFVSNAAPSTTIAPADDLPPVSAYENQQ